MSTPAIFCLCVRLQLSYAAHLIARRKARHNSKRHTLRTHRSGK